MLHNLLHSDDQDRHNYGPPVDPDDFEFFHTNMTRAAAKRSPTATEILLEIGQRLFKHNYMRNKYGIDMFEPKCISNLYTELQDLIRCDSRSPAGTLLTNVITSSETLVDVDRLFEGKWPEVKAMLDFIGKYNKTYKPFDHPDDEDDIYERMFR